MSDSAQNESVGTPNTFAESSTQVNKTSNQQSPDQATHHRKVDRARRDFGSGSLNQSMSSRERTPQSLRPKTGQESLYAKIGSPTESQSSTNAFNDAERLKNHTLYNYKKIWGSHYTLSLDGGGVRGYSQLVILKALMDKVAKIEMNNVEDGNRVESSFHPLLPQHDKSAVRKKISSKRKTLRKEQDAALTTNGKAKGKQVEKQSDTSFEVLPTRPATHFYPYHYFDWIAGTSTGGLNAIMLGRLRMSVDECLDGYTDMAQKVFGKPRFASWRFSPLFWPRAKYSGDRLRKVVEEVVAEHLCEGEDPMFAMNKEMCRTVVFAMKKTIDSSHDVPQPFRTYDHHRWRQTPADGPQVFNPLEKPGPADSSMIWEIARATSAAPSYFGTIEIRGDKYCDGGFGLNNPSFRLLSEVSQMSHNRYEANGLCLSIGTGISRFTRFEDGLLKRPFGWLNAAKRVATDCEETHGQMLRVMALLRTTHNGKELKYFRLNVPENDTDPDAPRLSSWQQIKRSTRRWFGHGGEALDRGLGKIKLDEWKSQGFWRKESTQMEMERITKEYLQGPDVDAQLDEIAQLLVTHRRERARTSRWAAYALGIRYQCPVVEEGCPDDTWTEKMGLRRHLIEDHGFRIDTPEAEQKLEDVLEKGMYYEDHH